MTISRSVLLRTRNVSDKSCRENKNTHFVFSEIFPKIVPFKRQCKKIMVEPGRPQMTIWRMRVPCWITKATNTHSEYVLFIYFLLQQWLHERGSMSYLYCNYIVLFICFCNIEVIRLYDPIFITDKLVIFYSWIIGI